MDVNVMELARARWQAAQQAWFVADVGEGGDQRIPREAATLLKAGPVLVAATVAASWVGVVGIVIDQGTDAKDPGKTRRVLLDLTAVIGMGIKD